MRSVLALGLLIALSASANAATVHLRTRQHAIASPSQNLSVPPSHNNLSAPRFAIPGWSDDATRRWLDNASRGWKQA